MASCGFQDRRPRLASTDLKIRHALAEGGRQRYGISWPVFLADRHSKIPGMDMPLHGKDTDVVTDGPELFPIAVRRPLPHSSREPDVRSGAVDELGDVSGPIGRRQASNLLGVVLGQLLLGQQHADAVTVGRLSGLDSRSAKVTGEILGSPTRAGRGCSPVGPGVPRSHPAHSCDTVGIAVDQPFAVQRRAAVDVHRRCDLGHRCQIRNALT